MRSDGGIRPANISWDGPNRANRFPLYYLRFALQQDADAGPAVGVAAGGTRLIRIWRVRPLSYRPTKLTGRACVDCLLRPRPTRGFPPWRQNIGRAASK